MSDLSTNISENKDSKNTDDQVADDGISNDNAENDVNKPKLEDEKPLKENKDDSLSASDGTENKTESSEIVIKNSDLNIEEMPKTSETLSPTSAQLKNKKPLEENKGDSTENKTESSEIVIENSDLNIEEMPKTSETLGPTSAPQNATEKETVNAISNIDSLSVSDATENKTESSEIVIKNSGLNIEEMPKTSETLGPTSAQLKDEKPLEENKGDNKSTLDLTKNKTESSEMIITNSELNIGRLPTTPEVLNPTSAQQNATEKETVNAISSEINDQDKEVSGESSGKVTKEDCLKLLRKSFDGYDYNGNGTVAHEEVREAWSLCQKEWKMKLDENRSELEATIFMKDIDKDGDGQVDFEEYVKYFRYLWLLSQGFDV